MVSGGREITRGAFTALLPSDLHPNAPVVVIGGWAGAQDRALRKYAELMASMGYATVRSVQPTPYIFSPVHLPRRRWALALLEFLRQQGLSPPRCAA